MSDSDLINPEAKKWWANALMVGAVVALACLPIGALGTKFGLWAFTGGFMLLSVGAVLAAAVFFLGIIALVVTTVRKLPAERTAVALGFVISLMVLGTLGGQYMAATTVPEIHNISTDVADPPQFDTLIAVREAEQANPLEYTMEVAQKQQAAYPQIKPLVSTVSPDAMFSRAVAALEDLGMHVANADPAAGRIEATDETFWFGFKDDVVVRIQSDGAGSVVDVRSVSRVGRSDLGKNAARIAEILKALQ